MSYSVDLGAESWVDFAPATPADEVGQNIRTIVGTYLGTVPGARDIGVDYSDLLDEPVTIQKARLGGVITAAIMEQEPRAQITKIEFREGDGGRLFPIVYFELVEEATT